MFYELHQQKIPKKLFTGKVDISVTAYFNKRPIDSDNVPAKLYIDPLKGWLLREDNHHCVGRVTTEAILAPEESERVEILILENPAVL